jgi:hypothetical protein
MSEMKIVMKTDPISCSAESKRALFRLIPQERPRPSGANRRAVAAAER